MLITFLIQLEMGLGVQKIGREKRERFYPIASIEKKLIMNGIRLDMNGLRKISLLRDIVF